MADEVTIQLRNPPSEAEVWQLALLDWDITVPIYQIGGLALVDVAEPITFEIPGGLTLPLRIMSLSISKWIDFYGTPALQHLYEMQSFRPYLWDFDKMEWSDIPDPTYREVFIPDLGSYYFDVATEALYEAIPALALWPLAIVGGLGILGLGATVALAMARR